MPFSLAIDYGSSYVGLALVEHSPTQPNRVRYAGTLIVKAKPLNERVEPRAQARRIRRTRKTHQRRLRRLAQALHGIAGASEIMRFCRRRGFSYEIDEEDTDTSVLHVSRQAFFTALQTEIERHIAEPDRKQVLTACQRHLNAACNRQAELRPARFENRGPSKCQWEGCRHNVPKAGNDVRGRLQQALYVWLKPILDVSPDAPRLRKSVGHWLGELEALSTAHRKSAMILDETARKERQKEINHRIKCVYKNLVNRVKQEAPAEVAEKFAANWKEHYCKNLGEIIRGKQSGRVRYCRQHSDQFVEWFLAGRQIPNRVEIEEADLISRKQQIVFRRLWRYIEARLLPLAGGKIDRVIVERVAIDTLAGPYKARQKVSEERAAEMYWYGPQFGFESRWEMLKAEFNGKCAYCDTRPASEHIEHILPRSAFPFDSYLNYVPACSVCNQQKGARTPLGAGMTVTAAAYEAYCEYVSGLKVRHRLHDMKKGLLNLLRRPGGDSRAEQLLGMIASNLVSITNTQRSPRPLARYLATQLAKHSGERPTVGYSSGRHTAIYRAAVMPDYDKAAMKVAADLRNHAVDAILLACEFPSAAALENTKWYKTAADVNDWFEKVRAVGPAIQDGLPVVDEVEFIPYFERDTGGGYCEIDLSAFNWNRKRRTTCGLDPFGMTKGGKTLKRGPASTVLDGLRGDSATRAKTIASIANRGLRRHLEKYPSDVATRFVKWLQRTTAAGLANAAMTDHPADRARLEILQDFVNTPAATIASNEKQIPWLIGVQQYNTMAAVQVEVSRVDKNGKPFQWYKSDPAIRELWVCYAVDPATGEPDREKPTTYAVNALGTVQRYASNKRSAMEFPEASRLNGKPFGTGEQTREWWSEWQAEFDTFCLAAGLVERFRLTQGCVIQRDDGTVFQLRNFRNLEPWMRGKPFHRIVQVHRSPLLAASRRKIARPIGG